jgi:hypothetical protein
MRRLRHQLTFAVSGNTALVPMKPYEIETIRISFNKKETVQQSGIAK